jgi:hypothetical protein
MYNDELFQLIRAAPYTLSSLEAKIRALPPELQHEVEDFIDFLLEKRRRAELEQLAVAHGWTVSFSKQQDLSMTQASGAILRMSMSDVSR